MNKNIDKIDFVKLNTSEQNKILNTENNFLKLFVKGMMKKAFKKISDDDDVGQKSFDVGKDLKF